jgi:NAD(P)-dependent dehydrogenase (short-subunit alcohol dehydrogenase family)
MSYMFMDKVAIVTGASSGIGAATARELAQRGAHVVLAARRAEELETQVRLITEAGGHAIAVPTDITDPAQINYLVQATQDAFDQIDILINNAGASWGHPVADTSEQELIRLLHVNLLGAMLLTRAVLPIMLPRRSGAIISVSSVAGIVATEPLYSAAKFGVRGFSLALRRQLVGSGISVSLVVPGNIRTRMTVAAPQGLPAPEMVAHTIANLVTHPRRQVIVPAKYQGMVWLDQVLPDVADALFYRRHHHDGILYPFTPTQDGDAAHSLQGRAEEYRAILMQTRRDISAIR